jgi:hypothetical protein
MRRGSSLRQRFGRTAAKRDRSVCPFFPNLLQFHGLRPSARDDDQIDTVRQDPRREAKALSAEALDAIASHGTADLATHDQADPGPVCDEPRRRLRGDEKHEVPRQHAACVRLDAPKIRLTTQSLGAIEGRAQGYFL